ncbi:hypothetical protein [Chryseobacterium sp. FH1]|uniref:hypothetical protein n=1 Tax=Chryseobacterium sp. FH1 TaxID=1233951 RepID=UPI000AF74D48|nr:hypothetical protein [Chryseobacterium sp. FH1]
MEKYNVIYKDTQHIGTFKGGEINLPTGFSVKVFDTIEEAEEFVKENLSTSK